MKVSLNWVKEYTKIKLPPDKLKERVSVSLTEVENIIEFGEAYKGIIAARVVEVKPHPHSENLLVLQLDIGETEYVQVVVQNCPVRSGDTVAYIKPGLAVPESAAREAGAGENSEVSQKVYTVEKAKVKGVESNGMVPSGRELGLNYDHTTVYEVPDDLKPGEPIEHAIDLVDHILEIKNKALTHRPDAFSLTGIAREIAAVQRAAFKPLEWIEKPEIIKPDMENVRDKLPLRLINEAEALCKRYVAVVLENVEVKPSPVWMQVRLAKMGIHPVNNIVDISNYLMLLTGQPSHAFDYDSVIRKDPNFDGVAQIKIRLASPGEKITVRDGSLKDLYSDTVVIADSENPIGIAGVMGGKDTEIKDDTTRIIFQVENLEMYNIRRTSMKTGIFSDAVTRFSKGLDPNTCGPVLYKAVEMIQQLSGGKLASKIHDYYPDKREETVLTVNPGKIRKRLGVMIQDSDMKDILERLGLKVEVNASKKDGQIFILTIPTWRPDLNIPQDIDEEIIRIYGYDKVEPTLPSRTIHPVMQDEKHQKINEIKKSLKSIGANELYSYSFVGLDLYDKYNLSLDNSYKLKNALSSELEYMRPLLLPSVADKLKQNLQIHDQISLFEIDIVNDRRDYEVKNEEELPVEYWHLALVNNKSYYHAKLYLDTLMEMINVSEFDITDVTQVEESKVPHWVRFAYKTYDSGRSGYIFVEKKLVGIIGQFDYDVIENNEFPPGISGFEIRMEDLMPSIRLVPSYKEPSKYPFVEHDFSFVVDSDVPYDAIESAILDSDSQELIVHVESLDIYKENQDSDLKKVTVRVRMQSDQHTLTEQEIDVVRKDIVDAVEKRTNGELAEK